MLDENERVIKPNAKKANKLQKEFVRGWLGDNQQKFTEVMDKIYMHDPRVWAKLYIEHEKLIIPRAASLNVNHGMSKDMEELLLMGRTASRPIGSSKDDVLQLENFTTYEELSPLSREEVG